MIQWLIDLFDPNKRELRRLQARVDRINEQWEEEFRDWSIAEMRERIQEIRGEIVSEEDLEEQEELMDHHLNEVFAIVREVAERKVDMRHYDVQMVAAIVLHQGRIAEQKTGEGKTLSATCPIILNAMTGGGVHIVTVNDYLARRDAEWMGPVYESLGFSVGSLQHEQEKSVRKEVYEKDIIYGTNHAFGFDYLRDNMVIELEQRVQNELNFVIIDEVDSILIDEARTPLIISGRGEEETELYHEVDKVVSRLEYKDVTGEDKAKDIFEQLEEKRKKKDLDVDWDYEIDRKKKSATLTWKGIQKVEEHFDLENLYDFENSDLLQKVQQALKAHGLFTNEEDYIVKDGQIVIVDEFTGRLMYGRRYNEGLHQAIEAKEGLQVQGESQTLATVTIQNFFRMYNKLSGMTGTAKTEEEEFREIYGTDVVVVPTNEPVIRDDKPDAVYKNQKAKWNAIVEEIAEAHSRNQPILVGTVSVEKSEKLSRMLKNKGVPHNVLNAKHHEQEAKIVAQAGQSGQVTIATNMAGRGTDIILGGNPEFMAEERAKVRAKQENIDPEGDEEDQERFQELFEEEFEKAKEECQEDRERVLEAGGLYVIGTERHEARRIDNQLRGRAGRQGDPGASKFFLALDDDLLQMFAMGMVENLMDVSGHDPGVPLESSMLSNTIEKAQKKVEGRNFDIRKHVLEYDNVVNRQREVIYEERDRILQGEDLEDDIEEFLRGAVENWVESSVIEHEDGGVSVDYPELYEKVITNLPVDDDFSVEEITDLGPDMLVQKLGDLARDLYKRKEEEVQAIQDELGVKGENWMRELERVIMLRTIDRLWIDHLNAMQELRDGVRMRGYGRVDPIVVYSREAYEMFEQLKSEIQADTIATLFRAEIDVEPIRRMLERQRVYQVQQDNYDEASEQPEYGLKEEKKALQEQQRAKGGENVQQQDEKAQGDDDVKLNRRQRRQLKHGNRN